MEQLSKQTLELRDQIAEAIIKLKLDDAKIRLDLMTATSQSSDFWNDSNQAQSIMKQIAKLESRIKPWFELRKSVDDLSELAKLNDESLVNELDEQFNNLNATFDGYKESLKLDGPYDDHDAILSIHAGAGGTDAQDWAQMLLRMYTRFAEKNGWTISLIDESLGEEAGLKSVTLDISGSYTYGKLKGEHGVHRLVRLSPFNADNLRQTSFAKVEVMPKIDQPEDMALQDKELKIDVYRSGGHGGQSVNTTDSAVRITHLPTGISVAIQNERSQLQNRETAMTILRSRLAQLQLDQHKDKLSDLKGPNQSAEWGNQIRSYVLHPYKQVKDLRTKYETSDPDAVLGGDLSPLIEAYLEYNIGESNQN
jgi:peptide chain release factor 2